MDQIQSVDELTLWHGRTLGLATCEALRKNQFDAGFFEHGKEVLAVILSFIKQGNTIGFGGSQTIRQLGLKDELEGLEVELLDHNAPGLDMDAKLEVMRRQLTCDVFICSSNAITMNGELINVDGNGNRLSAMIFGPGKVIVVAGINKIVKDQEEGWERIRQKAAPMNLKRLNRPTPCVQTGICMDCAVPMRGCNAYGLLRKKPSLTDFSVFIVNEILGF